MLEAPLIPPFQGNQGETRLYPGLRPGLSYFAPAGLSSFDFGGVVYPLPLAPIKIGEPLQKYFSIIMKTTEQIVERIGYIYHHRPLMYGGSPEGVETLLFYYHELWAEIVGRQKEYINVRIASHEKEECNCHGFSGKYLSDNPEASDIEVVEYAVTQ